MARPKSLSPRYRLRLRWDGYYDLHWREDNKNRIAPTGTKSMEKAIQFKAKFSKSHTPSDSLYIFDIAELIERYIRYRRNAVSSPETFPYVFDAPKRLIGYIDPDSFTQSVSQDYILKRRKEHGRGRYKGQLIGDATINKELRMIRAVLNWGHAERLINFKPNFKIELTSGLIRDRWLTKEEAVRLVNASSDHLALFIRLALSTGKRRTAILDLTWDRVDLTRPGHEFLHFGEDIGNKRRGSTPIASNPPLIQALREAKRRAKTKYVIEWHGKRVKDVKIALRNASLKANIVPTVSSHVLKHTAITWMVQSRKLTYEQIAKYTNTSKETIERVYAHHDAGFVSDACEALIF